MSSIVQSIVSALAGKLSKNVIVFIVSMIPLLELRGSILAAGFMHTTFLPTYIAAVLGNMLPIPFILLFIEKIFNWLKKSNVKVCSNRKIRVSWTFPVCCNTPSGYRRLDRQSACRTAWTETEKVVSVYTSRRYDSRTDYVSFILRNY